MGEGVGGSQPEATRDEGVGGRPSARHRGAHRARDFDGLARSGSSRRTGALRSPATPSSAGSAAHPRRGIRPVRPSGVPIGTRTGRAPCAGERQSSEPKVLGLPSGCAGARDEHATAEAPEQPHRAAAPLGDLRGVLKRLRPVGEQAPHFLRGTQVQPVRGPVAGRQEGGEGPGRTEDLCEAVVARP